MKGHFSNQSDYYARYRPTYPDNLFQYISSLCNEKKIVWDAATGNGQAARSLSSYFLKVIATDFSNQQIGNAFHKENIIYKIENAEESSIETSTVDLVTVATAIHWFNIPKFYEQVERVLKPGGVLAVWSYAGCTINTELDKLMNVFAFDFLANYWPVETQMNWKDKYVHLPFPYRLIDSPDFFCETEFSLKDLINYMFSWSGVQQYIKQHGENPLEDFYKSIMPAWGNENNKKKIRWELLFKCGMKPY